MGTDSSSSKCLSWRRTPAAEPSATGGSVGWLARARGRLSPGASCRSSTGAARGGDPGRRRRSSSTTRAKRTFNTLYVAAVGKIRMLSQRLAKAAQQASQGNREAFKQLRDSRDEFAATVKLLFRRRRGERRRRCRRRRRACAPQLDALDTEWKKTERNAGLVIGEEPNLVAPGRGGARDQRQQPGAAGAGRRDRGAERAERRQRAPERDHRAARHADAAHGEERQRHAGGRRGRPRSGVPARQGHQHLPRHAARAAAGQRGPAHRARERRRHARQARRAGDRLQAVPGRREPDPRQHAAPGERQARDARHLQRQRDAARRCRARWPTATNGLLAARHDQLHRDGRRSRSSRWRCCC